MVDPVLVGGVTAVAGVIVAATYSYLSGEDSSAGVDVDEDGENEAEFTFEGNEDATADVAELPSYQLAPKDVRHIGTSLVDIKGIGPTRADALNKADLHTASDLYFASDEDLKEVNGIGDLTVSQIREDIGSVEGSESSVSDGDGEASSSNGSTESKGGGSDSGSQAEAGSGNVSDGK